ncbi:peptide ABC transporter permease [Desulfosarcina alkanivorans]|uniref:Peptide ABC transporter permease n=1 Tax=Desulfosarcina alkanivorans TaxID=571177 RepID=A0A5K7YRU6_9BACT|nr:ABC transporter permease [Desulfosarcina alkanivorans]BBO71080.1 peptide ABC transporter permease [Desulfosarcina alkanivorans]
MSVSYLLKRLMAAIPVLFIVSVMVFLFLRMIPGDPATAMLGRNASAQEIEAVRLKMGLDRPLPVQYATWLGKALHGDLGLSVISGRSISRSILERLPHTMALAFLAIAIAIAIAIPSGVTAAVRQNTLTDRAVMLFSLLGVSLPSFWVGILFIILFSVQLGWFPSSGYVSIFENFFQGIRYLLLPAVSLALVMAAVSARMARSAMLEVLRQDYIRTARAKGLSRWAVVIRHGLKNAMIPVITVIGLDFGWLLGGTVVIETVFGIPGMGRLVVYSILNRDYPVVQGVILYMAIIYMLVNLLVDFIVTLMNPRIRY